MKKLFYLAPVVLLVVAGCKPTEKNYKAAYDVATSHKQEVADMAGVDVNEIQTVDGPRREVVDDVALLVSSDMVSPPDKTNLKGSGPMGVVIGKYNMSTNAKSQAAALSSSEPQAAVYVDGKGYHYVVTRHVSSVAEAADYIKEFRQRHPDYPYVGLDGAPLVVYIR